MTAQPIGAVVATVVSQLGVRLSDFPKYVIYRDGTVVSYVSSTPRVLIPIKRGKYYGFTLLDRNGDLQAIYHHRLVAQAFHGPCPLGQETRHKDGNREHNAADNLCWGTRTENMRDKNRHGTQQMGENHPMAKLTEADVLEMRRMRENGVTFRELADRFHVTTMTSFRAVTGQCWKHLT